MKTPKLALLIQIAQCILSGNLATALYSITLMFEFPNGTWLENLAVRPSGSIITTILTAPELYLLQPNPRNPKPE